MIAKSILVVEDDEQARGMLAEFLAEDGCLVYQAGDGQEAIEIVIRDKPSVVFLDLRLPRMSGIDVLKQIMKFRPETLVIILTGSRDESIAKEALALGAYDYLTKPVSLQTLESTILNRIFQ